MTIIFLAALLTCGGAVTDKTPGWRFEASTAKGGVYFNALEGYYPDKGGKLVSARVKVTGGRYYRLTFDARANERGYEAVNFYDGEGKWIADNYDVVYAGERQHYDRVVYAMPGTAELEVFFQSKSGLEAWDVAVEEASIADAAEFCDRTYAKLPPLAFKPEGNPLALAPRTLAALKTGRPWRILLLGDSIVQDTYHSQFPALVQRLYPEANVTWLVSVRGSTGCWFYQDEKNFADYVTRHRPDCVMIGGISNWIHPDLPLNGAAAIEVVANRIVDELKAEVIVMTPTLSYDLRDPESLAAWNRPGKVAFGEGERQELAEICRRRSWPFWDLYTPAYDWLTTCDRPINFYSRDQVHSGELGKQLIARLMEAYFAAAGVAGNATDADSIVNGIHGYMSDSYVVPKEAAVRERLEWFKDQKLALMMHFGMYSQMGIYESWPLSDADAHWSRRQLDWVSDGETFKRQYWNLWRSFNPTRFQPQKWAKLAKDNGFRYLIFTTKHHDGFCLFDTKYTDFKVTNPACPFASDPRADVVKHVFEAFRAQGLGIAAYFSKPDWHNEDFWEDHGLGRVVSRMPTYDVKSNPEKWARFREFTKNQIVELVRDYGPLDVIWLDGGQVQRKTGLDIDIEDIISEARKYKPDLISVDRTAGGACENVITPEQTVPPQPLDLPWESCITMGTGFSYRYDDEFKSPRELVHLLLDVVANGGNLALNVAPGPDGRLPEPAIERMEALGSWLRAYGEGVYGTRPAAPYAIGNWRFTGKDGKVYAFLLWNPGQRSDTGITIPVTNAEKVVSVAHLARGVELDFAITKNGLELRLPESLRLDPNAEGFVLTTR